MKFEEAFSRSLYKYPGLFYNKSWKRCRQLVMDLMFVVIGNGYAWHDETGEMVISDEAEHEYYVEGEGWRARGELNETPPKYILTKKNFKVAKKDASEEDKDLFKRLWRKTNPWVTYGVDSGGKICYLPDNIEDSWLQAAKEMLGYLREFYESDRPDIKAMATEQDNRAVCIEKLAEIDLRIKEIESKRL